MANGYGRSNDGFGIARQASVALIVKTAVANGVTDSRQIAYMLATAQHETRNFTAPDEDFGRQQAKKLGYRGGEEYFGRGYVHLTHIDNYQKFDKLLGLNGQLVSNPALAKDPEIAAKILVIGTRDGLFTGKSLSRYIDHDSNDTYNARRVVNGVNPKQPWSIKAARDCVTYAQQWEKFLTPERIAQIKESPIEPLHHHSDTDIKRLQSCLNQLGYKGANGKPLLEDGVASPQTLKALEEAVCVQAPDTRTQKTAPNASAAKAHEQKSPQVARPLAESSPVRNDARFTHLDEQVLQRLDDIYRAISTQKPQFSTEQNLHATAYWLSRAAKEQFPLHQPCSCVFETRNGKELMHTFFNHEGIQAIVTADINKGVNTPLEHSLAVLQQNAVGPAQEQNPVPQQRSTPTV